MIYILFLFLVIMFLLIVKAKKTYTKNNNSANISTVPTWENVQNEIIAEGVFEKIISNGLDEYLLSDFTLNDNLYYEDLRIPENAYEKLTVILCDVLKYLKLPQLVLLKVIYVGEDENKNHTTGHFQSEHNKKIIVIKIKKEYSPINVLAILCHECTHYFMEYNKLNFNDTKLNEIQTDIIATMIGFGEIMIEGYKEIVREKKCDNKDVYYTSTKVGYITSSDCVEIKKYLNYKRKHLIKERENQNNLLRLHNKLSRLYDTAIFLNEQINEIDFVNIDLENKAKIEQFQKALYSYECKNVNQIMSKIKETLDSEKDLNKLKDEISVADDLCLDLIKWLSLFKEN